MLIIIPIISDDFYASDDTACYNILVNYLSNYFNLEEGNTISRNNNNTLIEFINNNMDDNFPIINITYSNNLLYYRNDNIDDHIYRSSEIKFSVSKNADFIIIYSTFGESKLSGILSIIKTLLICILLTVAAILFESDTKVLVLEPLEVMIEIVENVAKDPINAKNIDTVQKGVKTEISKFTDKRQKIRGQQADKYEVKIIQSAILKISALLAIGFGEAGGAIITENITSQQDLNAMLAGKKKMAIFGFCDIRNFAAINEILQEKTMVFVNEISDIVHSSVDRYFGAANKNIGDAFLVVWKFANNKNANKDTRIQLDKKFGDKSINCQCMADMAVLAYLKIISRINRDRRILAYMEDPGIKEKLPYYKVNMGFGLHLGWAIEGAVGSSFKIDASYLSPNVNMAARLEAATRQYGVSLLISGQLYDFVSEDIKNICRLIDIVEVKGSKVPLKLYTIDVNLNLKPSKKFKNLTLQERVDMYFKKKQALVDDIEEFEVSSALFTKKTFKELLRIRRPKKFKKLFKNGIQNYLDGHWDKARKYLEESFNLAPDDKPTKVVIEYMRGFNFIAPNTWKGFRSLTSK
jgi:class 3 adenylate cyclase